jgi:AmiR/NasT family two-component response regulator
VLIERAKGVLAARNAVGVAEAFAMMRSHARRHGLPLTAVAGAVIDGSLEVRGIVGA